MASALPCVLHFEPVSENMRLEEPFLAVVRGHLHSTIARAFGEHHELNIFGRFILADASWEIFCLPSCDKRC